MRGRPVLAMLVCVLLVTLSGFGQAQDILFPPGTDVPIEILLGVIGRYMAVAQEYQSLIEQNGTPESIIGFRLAAKVDVPAGEADSGLSPVLEGISEMAFWVEASLFARHHLYFSLNLSGSLGNIEIISTPDGGFVIARDEAVYARMSSGQDIQDLLDLLPLAEVVPEDTISLDPDFFTLVEELPGQLAAFAQERFLSATIEYDGQELTPKGMAHIVRITFADTGQSIILWVLDETWELCKVGINDPDGGSNAIVIIEELDFVTSELPASAFDVDITGLAEISYEDFLSLVGLNITAAMLTGAPVAGDLSVSLPEVRQGEPVVVKSNGIDAEDEESDLVPQIEYRSANGPWTSLAAAYVGVAPLGHWEAVLVPSIDGLPGSHDFRVTYTDTTGIASDPLELMAGLNVIAIPPEVVDVSPEDRARDVPASSQVTVTFSRGMNKASVQSAFLLTDESGATVSGSSEWSDNTLVFSPDQGLMYGQGYTAKILGSAAALNTATLGDDFVWRFTTKFAPLPEVAEKSPGDGQSSVPISGQVTVTFTEDMNQASVEDAFSLMAGDQAVAGSFQWAGRALTFTPAQNLEYNTAYRVRIAGSASSALGIGLDGNGNGIAEGTPNDDVSWGFNSEVFPVIAVNPASETALGGDFVTVRIVAEAVSRLRSFTVTVDYNPEVLSLLKVKRRNFGDWRPRPKFISDVNNWRPTVIDEAQGLIVLAADSTRADGISGTGVLATITFMAAGVGESPIQLKDVAAANALGLDMAIGQRDGTVQVQKFDPWDTNHDGVVNILDFIEIQNGRGANADVNGDGAVDILDMVAATGGAQASPRLVPEKDELNQNYPNPFNPETWIPYQLARDANVVIRIYSTAGQLVRVLDLGYKHAGMYSTKDVAAYWDGTNETGEPIASGIYYYNIRAGAFSAIRKMVVAE
ncbi:Ig-like domain-containing protein [Candidatus Poribacteria bacterium]